MSARRLTRGDGVKKTLELEFDMSVSCRLAVLDVCFIGCVTHVHVVNNAFIFLIYFDCFKHQLKTFFFREMSQTKAAQLLLHGRDLHCEKDDNDQWLKCNRTRGNATAFPHL